MKNWLKSLSGHDNITGKIKQGALVMGKPKVFYLPVSSHTKRVFRGETFERLLNNFDVTLNEGASNYTSEQVAERIQGFEGLVTGWGTPRLADEVFENADKLRIIAHSAGSVKGMLAGVADKYIVPRDICVFSANGAIALNVAECTIGMLIMTCRRLVDQILAIRERKVWKDGDIPSNGQYLRGSTVGIVSASKVGREVIKLLQPFGVDILVFDPYLSEWDAGRLGVRQVAVLDELFEKSDFVTVHAPNIPETQKMIGERQLKLMKDGAVLVNTSRGRVIDHEALLGEAQTGRILVTLDVTDPEPLPSDHPLRELPNVFITPHISGSGDHGYFEIGETTLQALEDFFLGKPVRDAINFANYAQLA